LRRVSDTSDDLNSVGYIDVKTTALVVDAAKYYLRVGVENDFVYSEFEFSSYPLDRFSCKYGCT
jgi:hypothetical protein